MYKCVTFLGFWLNLESHLYTADSPVLIEYQVSFFFFFLKEESSHKRRGTVHFNEDARISLLSSLRISVFELGVEAQ